MAARTVIYADDERLRQKAKKVKQFSSGLQQLANDMLQTMRNYQGIGLAGPQIGVMQRIFVAEIPRPEADDEETEPHPQSGQLYVLVNPEIIRRSEALVEGKEGCLSIPGWYGFVERAEWIEVKALNEHGKKINLQVDGLLARIFQHEIDHLNGVLFVDHITDKEKLWQVNDEVEEESETGNASHTAAELRE